MQTLTVATVVIFVALCVIVDVRTRRIPNAISGAAMLLGVTLNTAYLGTAGLLDSLAGLGITVGVLLWPFAMGGIGGGDEKVMGTATMFQAAAMTRSLDPLRVSAADQGAVALPYSVPLGLGTLAALAFGALGL